MIATNLFRSELPTTLRSLQQGGAEYADLDTLESNPFKGGDVKHIIFISIEVNDLEK